VPVVWNIALAFALLVLGINASFYVWRARVLSRLPLCDRVDRLGVLNAAWTFLKDSAALAAVMLSIPLGWCLPRCRSGNGTRGGIILVHGWALNRGALWWLRRRLLRDGWSPVCCFEYRTLNANVEPAASALQQMITSMVSDGRPLTLIGHSLGGLVLRYCARRYPTRSVRRIVTLGTPHFGTELARFGPLRDKLAPGAPLLNKLNAVDHLPQQFDIIAIHSTFDAMVLPPDTARYPGAFNIQVNDVGHNALLFSSKVYRLIAENLAAPLS
jgi:triacylglycerol lipase